MNNEVMLFEALRRQAIEEDLEFYKAARYLVQANKDRNEEVWSDEEAAMTALVLRALDARIKDREKDLEE